MPRFLRYYLSRTPTNGKVSLDLSSNAEFKDVHARRSFKGYPGKFRSVDLSRTSVTSDTVSYLSSKCDNLILQGSRFVAMSRLPEILSRPGCSLKTLNVDGVPAVSPRSFRDVLSCSHGLSKLSVRMSSAKADSGCLVCVYETLGRQGGNATRVIDMSMNEIISVGGDDAGGNYDKQALSSPGIALKSMYKAAKSTLKSSPADNIGTVFDYVSDLATAAVDGSKRSPDGKSEPEDGGGGRGDEDDAVFKLLDYLYPPPGDLFDIDAPESTPTKKLKIILTSCGLSTEKHGPALNLIAYLTARKHGTEVTFEWYDFEGCEMTGVGGDYGLSEHLARQCVTDWDETRRARKEEIEGRRDIFDEFDHVCDFDDDDDHHHNSRRHQKYQHQAGRERRRSRSNGSELERGDRLGASSSAVVSRAKKRKRRRSVDRVEVVGKSDETEGVKGDEKLTSSKIHETETKPEQTRRRRRRRTRRQTKPSEANDKDDLFNF